MRFFSLLNLIKFAKAEDKIRDFEITDPWVSFLIKKYEQIIAWNGYELAIADPEHPEAEPKILQFKIKKENKEKDIIRFVERILLPQLFRKVDINHSKSQNTYYFNKIDMAKVAERQKKLNIVDPEFEKAYTVFQQDPVAGEQLYIDHLNQIKKNGFDTWVSYLKDHPDFSQEPVFVYLLLDKIFATSKNKDMNPVVAANPAVIGDLYTSYRDANFKKKDAITDKDKIALIRKRLFPIDPTEAPKNYQEIADEIQEKPEDVQDVIKHNFLLNGNFVDLYNLSVRDHYVRIAKQNADAPIAAGAYWKHFPRKDKLQPEITADGKHLSAQDVFDRNLDECTALSEPQGWCTTRSWFGKQHLTNGDFWVYVNNGVAEVGIRWFMENIEEIAGPQNQGDRSCPRKNWREIIKFINEKGWEKYITGAYAKLHWEQILQERELSKNFFNPDGTLNQNEVDQYTKMIVSSPKLYNRLDINQFHAHPKALQQLQEACIIGWGNELGDLQGNNVYKILEDLKGNYLPDMPDFVKDDPRLIEAIHGRLASGYATNPLYLKWVLEKVPNHLEKYPAGKQIFKTAVLDAMKTGIFWRARAIGVSKKTQEEKTNIRKAEEYYNNIIKVIADCMPELNNDEEFQDAFENAKQESMMAALGEGYVAREMPEDILEDFLALPVNYETLKNNLIQKIASAPDRAKSEKSKLVLKDKIYTENFIMSYLRATAPATMRKKTLFKKLVKDVFEGVLLKSISKYPLFDEKLKDNPNLYQAYKDRLFKSDMARLYVENKGKPTFKTIFDDRILDDPDFKHRLNLMQENVDVKKYQALLMNPSLFLKLDQHLQENPEIQDAYIRNRAQANPNKRIVILSEWQHLPQSLKMRNEAINGYVAAAVQSINTAMPNSDYYLPADGQPNKKGVAVDPELMNHPQIVAAFNAREIRNNKKASTGWYSKILMAN